MPLLEISPRRLLSPLLTTAVCVLLPACERVDALPEPGLEAALTMASGMRTARPISLEENPDVINVFPVVAFDFKGGFLVADEREAQIRRYSPHGRLLWHAGGRGGGPGEFDALKGAARLRSGEVVAADMNGRITRFDSAGTRVVRTSQAPLDFLEDMEVVDDSLVLLTAVRDGDVRGPRVHLWNLKTDSIQRSFFAPFPRVLNQTLATTAFWTRATVRGDTVAAIFSVSDSVYLFTLAGDSLGTIPLPSKHFRRAGREGPPAGARTNPVERAGWLSRFDYMADVAWLSDGQLLVTYISLDPGKALERQWHLLRMGRDGSNAREVREVPRLLAVDARTDSLYFLNPASEVASEWAVVPLRKSPLWPSRSP